MARKHNEDEVLRSLRKKHDVQTTLEKEVLVLTGKSKKPQFHKHNDLGNGSWGRIDYLVNYCGYMIVHVDEFNYQP